jgi:hypothetical protein
VQIIDRPVRVFRVVVNGWSRTAPAPKSKSRRHRCAIAAAAPTLVLSTGFVAWRQSWANRVEAASSIRPSHWWIAEWFDTYDEIPRHLAL